MRQYPVRGRRMSFNDRIRSASVLAVLSVLVAAFAIPAVMASDVSETWTVMVYLDGDNNLDPDAVADMAEMQQVGSTDKVNVIVLMDRYSEPAYLYKVLKGDAQVLDGLEVNGVPVNGQEISMADWHVLEAFADYCKANFPADHYILDLWDHGSPYGYACWDDHADPEWWTPARAISLGEVGMALDGFGSLDILTYDGCTIGMVEIAYELSLIPSDIGLSIEYLVASEEYIPNLGYDYGAVLGQMNSMSDVSATSVARMLADVYAATYSAHGSAKGSSTVGLSVIDVSMAKAIGPAVKALTDILKAKLALDFDRTHYLIAKARGEANLGWSLNGWDQRIDFGTFLETLAKLSSDPAVKTLAMDILGMITDAVYVANTPALASMGATGLGVWLPVSARSLGNANSGLWTLVSYTSAFKFSEDAGWMSFMYAFWGKAPKSI